MSIVKQITNKKLTGIVLWLTLLIFIFSIPLIPLILDKEVDVPFLDKNGNESALVFIGFRGCSDVCPMTLSMFKQLYDSQNNSLYWPQVVFLDIDDHSSSIQASNFAKQFHPSFVGLHIPSEQLNKISTQFGLNIKQQGNQIIHLGKTYLLRRKENNWRVVKVYSPNYLTVEKLQNELFKINS